MIPDFIIDFKTDETRKEFESVTPRLQAFILGAGSFMYFTYGVTLVVTDLLRHNMKSVHGHGNGVDFRTHNLTEEQGDALVGFLKEHYPYYLNAHQPPFRKYSIRDERLPDTSEGWSGSHLHGQVNWRKEQQIKGGE